MKRLLFCCAGLLIASWGQAQLFMRPFEPAPSMAMGGAVIAVPNTYFGLSNDAQLGLGSDWAVMAGSAAPYTLKDWQSAQVQTVFGLGKYSGGGLSLWHNATSAYQEQRFQLAYGRRLGEKFHLGASADLLRNQADEYGANTLATFSLSMLAQALPQVWVGVKLQNPLQQRLDETYIPTLLRLGASWQPSAAFLIALETEKDLERPTQVKAGVEYRPAPSIALRAGTRTGQAARMSFGAGFTLKNGIRLDLGAEWHPVLGITPAAMIAWRKTSSPTK